MSRRFIAAVALYGPKAEPFHGLLATVQGMISSYVGDEWFRPYTQEQVNATLISFDGIREADGTVINENFLTHLGERRPMDIGQAMEMLMAFFRRAVAGPDRRIPAR